MRDYELDIPAGESRFITVNPSNFLRVKTGAIAARYQLEDRAGREIAAVSLSEGHKVTSADEFTLVRATNSGGASLSVVLTIGRGNVDDSSISGTVGVSKAANLNHGSTACANAAATLVLTPDATCREIFISCPDTAANTVYLGGPGIAAGQGVALAPGAVANIPTNSPVYCRNDTGASVTLGYLEVRD